MKSILLHFAFFCPLWRVGEEDYGQHRRELSLK